MKKKIALLLGALLLLTGVFASCSTAETSKSIRWEENETYTFNITLADFANDGSGTFNTHPVTVKKEDGSEVNLSCYKDLGTTQEAALFKEYDQICPVDAKGTFTMSITLESSTTRKLSTTQVLYSQYETATLENLGCLAKLSDCVVTGDDNPFENNEGRTTLRNDTTAEVLFSNDAEQQKPIKSIKTNKGFYIGDRYQGVSNYTYETTYDFANRKVSVKVDDGEPVEKKLSISNNGYCIDASQVLLYLRSLDKSSEAFADSPSVAVYDPVTDVLGSATFSLERSFNALLNNNGVDFAASVNALYVSVDGRPFMAEYNLPDLTEAGENKQGYDFLPTVEAGKKCKYTTIKFRSNWYSYELSEYDQDILSAIDLRSKTVS